MNEIPVYRADVPIIAVFGLTDHDKSFFINKATGDADVKIGDGLDSGKSDLTWLHTWTADNPLKRLTGLLPIQLRLMGTRSVCLTR
jgi:hypothetical protein